MSAKELGGLTWRCAVRMYDLDILADKLPKPFIKLPEPDFVVPNVVAFGDRHQRGMTRDLLLPPKAPMLRVSPLMALSSSCWTLKWDPGISKLHQTDPPSYPLLRRRFARPYSLVNVFCAAHTFLIRATRRLTSTSLAARSSGATPGLWADGRNDSPPGDR